MQYQKDDGEDAQNASSICKWGLWFPVLVSAAFLLGHVSSVTLAQLADLPVQTLGLGSISASAFSSDLQYAAFSYAETIYLQQTQDWVVERTLEQHTGSVTALAFSPDGSLLASAAEDNTVRIWEVSTGEEIHCLESGQSDQAHFVAFNPTGTMVAASGNSGIRMWDVSTGQALRDLSVPAGYIAFSSHGLLAAAISEGIQVCEASTGEIVRVLPGSASCLAFSPDGSQLASASRSDDRIHLWDVGSGWEILSDCIVTPGEMVSTVAFSPRGDLVAFGLLEMQKWLGPEGLAVVLWDVKNGGRTESLAGTSGYGQTQTIAFSSTGNLLLWVERSREVGCWDVDARQIVYWDQLERIGHRDPVWAIAFSADGTLLATAPGSTQRVRDAAIILWDLATGQEVQRLEGHADSTILTVEFSPDGSMLASGSWVSDEAKIWDVETGEELFDLPHQKEIDAVTFSPDSLLLATGTGGYATTGEVILWDTSTGQESQRLEGHTKTVRCLGFSPDGTLLASGSEDRDVRVWVVESGWVRTLTGHSSAVLSVAFNADGTRLYSADTHNLIVWDVERWEEISRVRVSGVFLHYFTTSAFGRDGRLFGFITERGAVRLLDVVSGEIRAVEDGYMGATSGVAIASEMQLIAVGEGSRVKLLGFGD